MVLYKKAAKIKQGVKRAASVTQKSSWTFIVYMTRFTLRTLFFLTIVFIYFYDRDYLLYFTTPTVKGFFSSFGFHQIVWIILMYGMIIHLLPKIPITMGGRKSRAEYYHEPDKSYDKDELYRFVQVMNIKSWQVMLSWLLFNLVFALLYLLEVIGEPELILLTSFYFFSDLFCMMIFCPFQSLIMKNRCCVNCRIFDWGHFMIYTPMLCIKSWFSWSLFFTACIVLIRWEFVYASHPERFWYGSNASIRCENCKDRLCRIKSPLRDKYRHIQSDIGVYFKKLRR